MSAGVIFWGIWILFKQQQVVQPSDSIQSILITHIKYFHEVYRAHESYTELLHEDTCLLLIYRYSNRACSPCYLEDLYELDEFSKTIERDKVLVLPAYPSNDRINQIRLYNETRGLNYRNIHTDSMSLPVRNGEDMRYFAIMDGHGQIEMVFFPVKGRQSLTRRYFHEISRFFQAPPLAEKDSTVIIP